MTVSDAVIISRPCNNTSAEPIDSQVTAPRLWDHGQSAGLLPACFLPTTGSRNAARWGGCDLALTPRSPGDQSNTCFSCNHTCVLLASLLLWNDVWFSKL